MKSAKPAKDQERIISWYTNTDLAKPLNDQRATTG